MAADSWTEKLDAYFDGELAVAEARAVEEHLRGCAACTAAGLAKLQLKLAVQAAGRRFAPDPVFRARIQKSIAPRQSSTWNRGWLPVMATAAALLIAGALIFTLNRNPGGESQLLSELADMHVATLASANPVDVLSTDRHTVKPWFQGKIPFTFNLPELQDSPFVLVGGKVSYLHQSPGAELIFRVRQHQISVFIFQERPLDQRGMQASRGEEAVRKALSFEVRSWHQNGLRYFMIGDASPEDLDKLSGDLKAAG